MNASITTLLVKNTKIALETTNHAHRIKIALHKLLNFYTFLPTFYFFLQETKKTL